MDIAERCRLAAIRRTKAKEKTPLARDTEEMQKLIKLEKERQRQQQQHSRRNKQNKNKTRKNKNQNTNNPAATAADSDNELEELCAICFDVPVSRNSCYDLSCCKSQAFCGQCMSKLDRCPNCRYDFRKPRTFSLFIGGFEADHAAFLAENAVTLHMPRVRSNRW